MNRKHILILITSFIIGLLLFYLPKHLPLIYSIMGDSSTIAEKDILYGPAQSKDCTLCFWKDGKFLKDSLKIIWTEDSSDNLKRLINTWLNRLFDEKILEQKVNVESVIITQIGDVFISFEKQPLSKQWSIEDKWHFIETLMSSIKTSNFKLANIFFEINHLPMEDDHLDFRSGWPISGFLQENL